MDVAEIPTSTLLTSSTDVAEETLLTGRKLSLVIPAWNEEDSILQAIEEADAALSVVAPLHEIIVVDDGSTDRTARIVLDAATRHHTVRLVQLHENRGYSTALRTGFEAAQHELVAFTDADCQFDLTDLKYMLPLMEHYDIVSGYRIARKDPALRRFYSWGYNTLIQFLLGTSIRDVDCALKLFHREQLLTILPESQHFFANTEMLSAARARGMSIVDVGVQHRSRTAGVSKVSIRDVPKTLNTLLPYWWTRGLFAGNATVAVESKRQFWTALMILILVSGVLLFRHLTYPLIEPDEGRYAEIPREMLSTGNWIVPTLHHQAYLDKPPLFYWLCAGSYSMFGVTAWAARLVPAVATLISIICTFLFGRRMLGTRAAFLGALMLTLSLGFVFCGRFLILDSLLTCFVSLSLFTAYEAVRGERLRWTWWLGSAVCCGLGVLTKGPVACVLLAPPVLAHLWLSRSRVQPGVAGWAAYLAVLLTIVAPWYVAVVLQNPDFARHFFWEHNVMRFFASVNHPQPFWFYLPVVIVGWMPWGLLLVPLTVFLLSRSQTLRAMRPIHLGYFLLWSGWCLLFFSLSRGKLPPYILPAFPAMALLFGALLDRVLQCARVDEAWQRTPRFLLRHGILTMCIAGLIVSVGACLLQMETPGRSFFYCALWALAVLLYLRYRHRLNPQNAFALFSSVSFLIVFQLTTDLLPAWGNRYATLPANKAELDDRASAIACFGQDWGSVPFYLERDDIHYFNSKTTDELSDLVRRQRRVFLVLDHGVTMSEVRNMLPPGTNISTRSTTRKSTVLLLDSSNETSLPRLANRPGG